MLNAPSPAVSSSPALAHVQRYADDYAKLGAVEVTPSGADQVQVAFTHNALGTNAAAALADTVDGVRILVENRSQTADFHTPSIEGVSELISRHPAVSGVSQLEMSPPLLKVTTKDQASADALTNLFKSQLEGVYGGLSFQAG